MNPVGNEAAGRAQRAIAGARALFREGLIPESHESMLLAQRALVDAWLPAIPGESASAPASETEQALLALEQAHYPHLDRLRAALSATEKPAASDARKPINFPHDVEWLWTEIERLNRFTVRHFTPAAVRKRRRIQLGIALGLVLILSLVFVQRLWGRPYAHASGVISEAHLASNALDGLDGTEWLLPDGKPGWIDIIPPKPRTLHGVRLLNAHNEFYLDRASREVRVTAYSETGPLGSVEGAFEKLTQDRALLDLPLEAQQVVRVRIEVRSFFDRGGGFAEIELR
ncbi:MAG: hypothetical protein WDO74_23895 [Pseudomonadota bacterium]